MAITIAESFNSGPVTLDDRHEVRVREWEIRSTDPTTDELLLESDVVSKIRERQAPFDGLPRIGDLWGAFGTSLPPTESIAQPHDLDVEVLSKLRCVGGRIIKLGAPGAGGLSGFLYTTQFSTRITAWDITRSVEFSTRSKTVHLDLDAVLPQAPQGSPPFVSASPPWCDSWTSINAQKAPTPPGHWGNEASIRNGEGVDILEPVFTLTYRKLIFEPNPQALIEDLQAVILTTNAVAEPPDFDVNSTDADHWLFVGVAGGEIRSGVYDMTFKFLFDENRHRQFWYRTDQGSQLPLIDAKTSLPICRTYRGYQRAASWSPIMNRLFD